MGRRFQKRHPQSFATDRRRANEKHTRKFDDNKGKSTENEAYIFKLINLLLINHGFICNMGTRQEKFHTGMT